MRAERFPCAMAYLDALELGWRPAWAESVARGTMMLTWNAARVARVREVWSVGKGARNGG